MWRHRRRAIRTSCHRGMSICGLHPHNNNNNQTISMDRRRAARPYHLNYIWHHLRLAERKITVCTTQSQQWTTDQHTMPIKCHSSFPILQGKTPTSLEESNRAHRNGLAGSMLSLGNTIRHTTHIRWIFILGNEKRFSYKHTHTHTP